MRPITRGPFRRSDLEKDFKVKENARQAGNHALLVRDTHHDKPRIVSFESADRSTLVGICGDSESERSESIAAARAYARAG